MYKLSDKAVLTVTFRLAEQNLLGFSHNFTINKILNSPYQPYQAGNDLSLVCLLWATRLKEFVVTSGQEDPFNNIKPAYRVQRIYEGQHFARLQLQALHLIRI